MEKAAIVRRASGMSDDFFNQLAVRQAEIDMSDIDI